MKRVDIILVKLNSALIATMMFVMFVLVFSNVVTRYVFSFSMNWAEELSRYLMIWIAYLGAGLAMREGRHASIEVLQDLLPKPAVKYVRVLVALVILIFMGVLAFLGWEYSQFAMRQRTAVLRLPMGLLYLAIPIGAAGFILHLVASFREFINKEPIEDDHLPQVPSQKGETFS